ncbi:MAG: DNA alkylation repair protein [Rhizobiaceae bacterium]
MAAPAGPLARSSTAAEVVAHLKSIASDENRAGMKRYGINVETALGVPHGVLRGLQKRLKRDHDRALELWASGIREARVLASMTDEPNKVTRAQVRLWANDLNSWDLVDSLSDLLAETPFWRELVDELAADEREFVRRAAFAIMAWSNVPRHGIPEETRLGFLPLIERYATDERNFVKKAVNWALRQTGKSSLSLHAPALALARKLAASESRAARWTGKDAVRELSSEKVLERLAAKPPNLSAA